MKNQSICRQILFLSLVILLTFSGMLQAQSSSPRRPRMGLYGDWEIKVQFGERQMNSILSFSRNAEGAYTGRCRGRCGDGEDGTEYGDDQHQGR